jgi:AcrR family transcriptional regulator
MLSVAMSNRWASGRAERRPELLEAASRAIRRHGPGVSMDRMAAEAGIAKPILYRHFGDKAGLYQALAKRHLEELMATLQEALSREMEPEARLRTTIDSYLAHVEREPEVYRFLVHSDNAEGVESQHEVGAFIRQVAAQVAVVVREELSRAGMRTDGAEAWAHGIVGMVQSAGDWWLETRSLSRAELVDHLVILLWLGFSRLPANS